MPTATPSAGCVVILNGAPRAGKTSIALAMQEQLPAPWLNLGVDAMMHGILPRSALPALGLRPGGERPDLEDGIERQYLGLYGAVAAFADQGLNVVVDVGHHDDYSRPLKLLPRCCALIAHLPTLLVGVHCPLEEILRRRHRAPDVYASAAPGDPVPAPVLRWQQAVHEPGRYDLELNTGNLSATECVQSLAQALVRVQPGQGRVAQLAS
ncbi:MAG: chloramphenicol phosphotransferase CPT family protein [Pseudomonadales bacterium]